MVLGQTNMLSTMTHLIVETSGLIIVGFSTDTVQKTIEQST